MPALPGHDAWKTREPIDSRPERCVQHREEECPDCAEKSDAELYQEGIDDWVDALD